MDHVAGPLHILLAEKEGRIWFNIICLKLYQFEKITRWCLFVLESITLGKIFKKNHNLMEFVVGDYETLSMVRHVGLRVDFSVMKSSMGL
jgi:hypothetical protein